MCAISYAAVTRKLSLYEMSADLPCLILQLPFEFYAKTVCVQHLTSFLNSQYHDTS